MTAVELLLTSFDDVWSHSYESTTSVLTDLTPEEAAWQHVAYAGIEKDEELPPEGTILWHLAHLEYCTRFYTDVLRNRPVEENLPVTVPSDLSLPALVSSLDNARQGFRNEVALLSDDDLDAPCHYEKSVAEFVRMVIRHESWHGGQIAVLRRLYRERSREGEADNEMASVGRSILELHHAQITISPDAVDHARTFYCGTLGLAEVPKPESLQERGGFWFQVGDRQVHVGIEEGVDRTKTKAHLAYHVEDLEGWRAHLIEHGIEILDGIPIHGYDRFEFRDPFGNRVEMIKTV